MRRIDLREAAGGLIVCLFGLAGILEGVRLGTGSLTDMGPGFMPTVFGSLLVLLGLLLARGGGKSAAPMPQADWRGWSCIVLGVLSFILLGPRAGLIPATLSCVFIAALGNRHATLKGAAALAIGVAVFGAVLFHYLLQVNLPLFGNRT